MCLDLPQTAIQTSKCLLTISIFIPHCSVQFRRSVVSDSLRPHEPQHARPPCPSPTPRVHPNPCPLSRWCHPTISSSVVPFSSCPQSFPASGCPQGLSISFLFRLLFHSMELASFKTTIPFYVHTTFCLSIHPWMNAWDSSTFWLLWIMLLGT